VLALVDRGFQTAYWVAHRLLRAYWFVRNPATTGSLVAVWHAGELLVVKNSYRTQYTLPGGYVRPGETPAQAGARELLEEVNIVCDPQSLELVYSGAHPFEFRQDALTIVETEMAERPVPEVDNREVIWAGFMSPEQLRRLPIVPHLAEYLTQREHPESNDTRAEAKAEPKRRAG
jgi:8-oxo-dGTP pyrophosphatase MutT (NUDIX family)